ncbi:MAG: porin family protein [Candidatus Kaistia colombiensis]|nr:MAG: porin family protein [Kaistia sp.]
MKFILRSATMASVLALGVVGAQAADLTYEPAPVAAPVFNWTGFYIGVHAGIGGGKFDGSFNGFDREEDYSSNWSDNAFGAFGGAQIGYNYQFSPNWVAGVEADIAASGVKSDHQYSNYNGGGLNDTESAETKVDWFGTIRGRVGYAWDNVLFYGTGGAAYGNVKSNFSLGDDGGIYASSSDSNTRWGWTLGAGVEYGITKNITFKTEYLYVDLGKTNFDGFSGFEDRDGNTEVKTNFHTLKAGLNYKF